MAESILQTRKECYLCRRFYNLRTVRGLEEHHILYGRGRRALSEQYGLKVWLCHMHHNEPPLGVHFDPGARRVMVDTTYTHREYAEFSRLPLYEAVSDVPGITTNQSMTQEQAVVELQSLYAVTDDRDYLLALLSRIDVNQGVSSVDNGISQEVSVRTGAVLKEKQIVQPIVHLQPYRTFLEVEQPASDFLLRLDKDGRPALYEADGGAWKLEAKRNIAAYLGEQLADLVERGSVVVMI